MLTNQNKLKLDIACGNNKKPGFTGVDIWEGADIVCDLEKFPWPFTDDSVDEIFCSHYIEHTPDLIRFANELYRIMKVGASADIIAPYYSSIRAWQDPTHLRAISENTFNYFNKEWRVRNKLDHYPITADFDFTCKFLLAPEWIDKDETELNFAIRHYINVVNDIYVTLTKRDPADTDNKLLVQKAAECWEAGRRIDAVKICNDLIKSGEQNTDLYVMVAEDAIGNGMFEEACEAFRSALELDNNAFQAQVGFVRALVKSGHMDEAHSYLDEIRKTDPELAEIVEGVLNADDN